MLILLLESNWAAGVSAKNARFVAPTVIIYDMSFFMECNHCSAIYMNQVIAFFFYFRLQQVQILSTSLLLFSLCSRMLDCSHFQSTWMSLTPKCLGIELNFKFCQVYQGKTSLRRKMGNGWGETCHHGIKMIDWLFCGGKNEVKPLKHLKFSQQHKIASCCRCSICVIDTR